MTLLERIVDEAYQTLSLIGMAKNAGKTVLLNHLIDSAYRANIALGLTSIGRDGETADIVTDTKKPLIYAYANTLIATAERFIETAASHLEILRVCEEFTPLGRVVIARTTKGGFIELAGPSRTVAAEDILNQLRQLGATLSIIDGALDRRSTASPAVSDATILATGAVLSRDVDAIARQTRHRADLLQLSAVEQTIRALLDNQTIGVVERIDDVMSFRKAELKTALGAGRRLADIIDNSSEYLYLPGGLTEQILESYLDVKGDFRDCRWLVKDGTKIFISAKKWQYYQRKGLEVKVTDRINLIGISYNPLSPAGYSVNGAALGYALQQMIPNIEIIDVMKEEAKWSF